MNTHLILNPEFTYFTVNRMRRILPSFLLMFALASAPVVSQSFASATQTLLLEVRPVHSLSVSGNPSPLVIVDGTAGVSELSVQDQSTSYNVTSNRAGMKLSMSLDQSMPDGTKLYASVESTNGTSLGVIDLSEAASPVDVATNIGRGSVNNQKISYVFKADASVGVMEPESRTIYFTVTD